MIIDLLTEEEKKYLDIISYKKGEILFYENDVCDSIGIVVNGEIKISSFTFEGNEVIYNRLIKGDLFGNNLIFSKDNKYRGDVRSETDSKIAIIKKDKLTKLLMMNESFLKEYLSFNSEFAKSLNAKLKLLTFNNAKERFLYYLFINDNRIFYKNIVSLAHDLYLTREATSRVISSLDKEGKIVRNKHEIILHNTDR